MFRLFREPEYEEQTVIAVDPAEGGDDSVATAKSKKHADSFMVYQSKTDSSQLGYETHKMAKYIQSKTGNWPTIGVERNTGQATIFVLTQLNYPNLFRMQRSFDLRTPEEQERIGWVTTTATRPKMLDELALSIKQGVNIIYDKETIRQMMTFVRNRQGKPEAESGCNDDLVITEAIAWQLHQLVPNVGPLPEGFNEDNKDWSLTGKTQNKSKWGKDTDNWGIK